MEEEEDLFEGLELEQDIVPINGLDIPVTSEDIFGTDIDSSVVPTLLDDLLKLKGISDSKIIIIGEDEKEEQIDFYSLSKEEQLEILNNSDTETVVSNELDKTEIDWINELRSSDLSIEQWKQKFKDEILSEINIPIEKIYDIDEYNDQELFLLDLKNKYDLTWQRQVKKHLKKFSWEKTAKATLALYQSLNQIWGKIW